MNKHEWDKIVKDAFSPSKPEPPFSERYRRHRRELERMVNMKTEKKRFNAGFWAIAVACCLVAVSPVAIHNMTQSRLTAPEQPSQINPASLADGENLAVAENADQNESIPIYTIGFNVVPSQMNSSVITTLHTDVSTNETYYIAKDLLTSTSNEHKSVLMELMKREELVSSYQAPVMEQGTLDNGYSVVYCYADDGSGHIIERSHCYVYVDFNNGWGTEIQIQGLSTDEIKELIAGLYFNEGMITPSEVDRLAKPDYRMGFNSVPEGMNTEMRTTVYCYNNQEYYAEIPYFKRDDTQFVAVQFVRSDDIGQMTETINFPIYDESTLPNGIQATTYATTDENGELIDNFVTYTYLVFGDTGWGAEVFCAGLNYQETMDMMESVYFIPAVSQHEENVPAEIEDDFVERTDTRYKLVFDWLPDRMFYQHDGPYAEKIHSSDNSDPRSITPMLLWMADGTDVEFYASASSQFPVSDAHTLENGNRGVITCNPDFQDGDNCVAFVQLNDRYYVQLFCQGLTAEEVIQVMEGASIVEVDEQYTDDNNASIQTPQPAEYDIPENEEILLGEAEASGEKTPADEAEQIDMPTWAKVKTSNDKYFQIENLHLCGVGETVDYYEKPIDELNHFAPLTVCVNSVRVQSNFNGITTDEIGRPAEFSEYLDENGEIWTTRTIDGISEKVRQYVVITELTFTNNGDTAVEDVNYNNFIYPEKDGTLLYSNQTYENGLCPDSGNHFSISADSELEKNNIKRIESGQSVHVTCANMVDEDKFGHIYLELNSVGISPDQRAIIDLTNLKPEN
ncbi:MAG TPA: hypothetical protein DCO72_02920 [Ruminococcus sp.]|nr:hypothetical protein [Ruminococcus sp.]